MYWLYDFLAPVSKLFNVLLGWIHAVVPSYGFSIIILTIIFRAMLLPLDIKQKVSMKKTTALQPKIAKINEKYKNDKEKAAQKTMELYRQEKVSPFSGCLPALIQMPLFFAFFGALQILASEQILRIFELMQGNDLNAAKLLIEPWLWVNNVWQPDTAFFSSVTPTPKGALGFMGLDSSIIPPFHAVQYFKAFRDSHITLEQYTSVMQPLMDATSNKWNGWFILPLLAGLSSWWQTKITMPPQPANPDPKAPQNPLSGKTMQMIFPIMSVFFTASSNSIFALYWITSNVCAIVTFWAVDKYWQRKSKLAEADAALRIENGKVVDAKAEEKTNSKEDKKK